MKAFGVLIRDAKQTVILGVLASLISGFAHAGLISLIHQRLNAPDFSQGPTIWLFLAVCAFMFVSQIISDMLLLNFAQRTVISWRLRLSKRILSTPLRKLEEAGLPRLMSALTSDVNTIATNIALLPPLCYQITILLGCFIYMAWLSWQLFLITFTVYVVALASYQLPIGRAVRSLGKAREEENQLFGNLQAMTSGAKEMKVYRHQRESFLADVLEPNSERLMHHSVAGSLLFRIAGTWGNLVYMLIIAVVIFIAPNLLQVERSILSGYTFALLYMLLPLLNVINILPGMGATAVSLQNIERLQLALDSDASERPQLPAPAAPRGAWSELKLENITYTYTSEDTTRHFLLGPVSLALRPGEVVFIVGGNGSGKTTLAKLLTGLYTPDSGTIRLDGEEITEANRDDYRQLFSIVFSDFYLFKEFLGLKDPNLDSQAHDYLVKLQLDHKVQVKDGVLSTTDLSQGQRKRLALLTAYLTDRPLYLFDEWAADQDPVFRELFYTQLLPELKASGKTVVAITHDDRYHYVADRVIKIEYGQVSDLQVVRPAQAGLPTLELNPGSPAVMLKGE